MDWLEVAFQATAAAGLMFTVTVTGLVVGAFNEQWNCCSSPTARG